MLSTQVPVVEASDVKATVEASDIQATVLRPRPKPYRGECVIRLNSCWMPQADRHGRCRSFESLG